MDITLGELHKLPIKKLKVMLDKLKKEPKSVQNDTAMTIIKNIIKDKKGRLQIAYATKEEVAKASSAVISRYAGVLKNLANR